MERGDRRINIENIEVVADGRRVQYAVRYSRSVSRYFVGESFYVEYDRDMSEVPESLLAIPLLANLCPIAWIAGADVHVARLDRKFYESLLITKQSFSELYPRLKFSGQICVNELTEPDAPVSESRTAAFFSGGIDSMGTFIRRREENPYLITVWGADIGIDQPEMWHKVKAYNEAWALSNGSQNLFIKSNLRSFFNDHLIAFQCGRFTQGWWPSVQHGIGMIGLAAPLTYTLGIHRLYFPSALPPTLSLSVPDGSNVMINNHVQWAGTTAELEGQELTRQEKVRLIADCIRSMNRGVTIRVCWSNENYGNCCRCEKCLRTITALLAEGVDPRSAGFPIEKSTYALIQEKLPHWVPYQALKSEYWNEIRLRSIENSESIPQEARSFFDWFQGLDIPSFAKRRSLKESILALIPHPLFLWVKKMRRSHVAKS